MSTRSLGTSGELAVKAILEKKGYQVKWTAKNGLDLTVNNGLFVEVKTANCFYDSKRKHYSYHFTLQKSRPTYKGRADIVFVLRCLSQPPCHFVIPSSLLPVVLTSLVISGKDPRTYKGKYSQFLEAWDLIAKLDKPKLLG